MSRAGWDPASGTAGFVLAGGQSSRMGRDKALVELAGRPLVTYALDTLRNAGVSAAIAGARSDLGAYAPVVQDAKADCGPLSGMCAALRSTLSYHVVFVPVDLPLLPSSLIVTMLVHAQIADNAVTIVAVNGFAQTFPAVVRRDALDVFERELAGGRGGCFAAFAAAAAQANEDVAVLPVESLVQAGQVICARGSPAARWFSNLNSQRDVERVAACLPAPYRVS